MKFIVGTRLFSASVSGLDASKLAADRQGVRWRAELSSRILFPSLYGQTVRNFLHYTLINPVTGLPNAKEYASRVCDAGYDTTLVTPNEWREMLEGEWKRASNGLCVARIDDDDAVFSEGLEHAGMAHRDGKLVVYGWTIGLRCRIGEGFLRKQQVTYGHKGHMSVLQSCVMDSSAPFVDPYSFDHSNVVPFLQKKGWTPAEASAAIVNGDAKAGGPAYLYIRHAGAASTVSRQRYDKDSTFPRTDARSEYVCNRFGLAPDTLEAMLSGTAEKLWKAV